MISRTSKAQLMALCPGHDTQDGALTEALKALWAVRVLDAYAERFTGYLNQSLVSAADQRAALAEALYAEDPTPSPKGWP